MNENIVRISITSLRTYYQTVSFGANVLSNSRFHICFLLQALRCQLGPPLQTPLEFIEVEAGVHPEFIGI